MLLLPTESEDGPTDIGLVGAQLALAHLFGPEHFALGPVAMLELGWMFASAPPVPRAEASGTPATAIFGGLRLEHWFDGPLGLRVDLVGGARLLRPRFGLRTGETLYTVRPAAMRALVGLVARLE